MKFLNKVEASSGVEITGTVTHGATSEAANFVITYPTGSEPTWTDVPDGTYVVEYTP